MAMRTFVLGLSFTLAALPSLIPGASAADAPKLAVVNTIAAPDGGWDLASVDADARRLYVARSDGVMAVDLKSGKVTPRLVDGKRVHAVLPLRGGTVLATNGDGNIVILFKGDTGKVVASIPTGIDPDGAVFDPGSRLVLVMDGDGGDITLIDPKTASSPGRIAVGGKLEAAAVDGHGKAFVNVEDKGEIAVVDIAGRKVIARYPLQDCERPTGLALNPSSGLLIAACANKKALAVQSRDGSIAATLTIGERPDGAIYDPRRGLFFIPCGEGTLAAISEKSGTPSVIATVPTATGARTAALDSKTGRIYLPTADYVQLGEGEKRRKLVNGTFRVLVVADK
jgi:DNA-binding beta-propeller fold protein YncE